MIQYSHVTVNKTLVHISRKIDQIISKEDVIHQMGEGHPEIRKNKT